jgi:hypothetical protein
MSDFKVYLSSTIRAMSYSINVSIVVSSNSQNLLPFVQYSMYRGAMEPTWTSGVCPGGGYIHRTIYKNRKWDNIFVLC